MKKSFRIYSLIWALCLAVFNVIVFVTPKEIGGASKFTHSFWIGYIFITVAFVGQLVCAFFAFKANNLKKFFYRIPLISLSYDGLGAMLIAGSIFMVIPVLPEWIGIIVCAITLAFQTVAVLKATAAAGVVSDIDEKIKAQTFFMKSLTVDAQALMNAAKTDELFEEAKKVYEAIRYSDSMTNDALSALDSQIEGQFKAFADAVEAEDVDVAKANAASLIELMKKREQKCKLLKAN
ncbi:MAG: hypothetical protein IJY71_04685 [Clostridia bacterium]|nr:hypothetical protein [Clostridia bacterium]